MSQRLSSHAPVPASLPTIVRPPGIRTFGIRRNPAVVLLRTTYDIRSIIENGDESPIMNETRLAIAAPAGAGEPMIFDLTSEVFDLLAALGRWTDPAAFADLPDVNALIVELEDMRIVEIRR